MEIVVLVILIGLIPAAIASSKGRSFFLWWIYGMALFIVALPHSLMMGPEGSKRKCPYCSETIQTTASVCPHCNRDIVGTIPMDHRPDFDSQDFGPNVIQVQRAKTSDDIPWDALNIGKRLRLSPDAADTMLWNVESEDGVLGTISGTDAKRIAFFAETDGRPRGTVSAVGRTDEKVYRLGFTLSAVPPGG
jgi:hypothetical protein